MEPDYWNGMLLSPARTAWANRVNSTVRRCCRAGRGAPRPSGRAGRGIHRVDGRVDLVPPIQINPRVEQTSKSPTHGPTTSRSDRRIMGIVPLGTRTRFTEDPR